MSFGQILVAACDPHFVRRLTQFYWTLQHSNDSIYISLCSFVYDRCAVVLCECDLSPRKVQAKESELKLHERTIESQVQCLPYYRAIFFSAAILCSICSACEMQMFIWKEESERKKQTKMLTNSSLNIGLFFHSNHFCWKDFIAFAHTFCIEPVYTWNSYETMTFFGCNIQYFSVFFSIFQLSCIDASSKHLTETLVVL